MKISSLLLLGSFAFLTAACEQHPFPGEEAAAGGHEKSAKHAPAGDKVEAAHAADGAKAAPAH